MTVNYESFLRKAAGRLTLAMFVGVLLAFFAFQSPAQTTAPVLSDDETTALVDELADGLAEFTDAATAEQIVSKWNEREGLNGKTRAQVIALLFEDVKSIVADPAVRSKIWAAWQPAKQTSLSPPDPASTGPKPMTPPTGPAQKPASFGESAALLSTVLEEKAMCQLNAGFIDFFECGEASPNGQALLQLLFDVRGGRKGNDYRQWRAEVRGILGDAAANNIDANYPRRIEFLRRPIPASSKPEYAAMLIDLARSVTQRAAFAQMRLQFLVDQKGSYDDCVKGPTPFQECQLYKIFVNTDNTLQKLPPPKIERSTFGEMVLEYAGRAGSALSLDGPRTDLLKLVATAELAQSVDLLEVLSISSVQKQMIFVRRSALAVVQDPALRSRLSEKLDPVRRAPELARLTNADPREVAEAWLAEVDSIVGNDELSARIRQNYDRIAMANAAGRPDSPPLRPGVERINPALDKYQTDWFLKGRARATFNAFWGSIGGASELPFVDWFVGIRVAGFMDTMYGYWKTLDLEGLTGDEMAPLLRETLKFHSLGRTLNVGGTNWGDSTWAYVIPDGVKRDSDIEVKQYAAAPFCPKNRTPRDFVNQAPCNAARELGLGPEAPPWATCEKSEGRRCSQLGDKFIAECPTGRFLLGIRPRYVSKVDGTTGDGPRRDPTDGPYWTPLKPEPGLTFVCRAGETPRL